MKFTSRLLIVLLFVCLLSACGGSNNEFKIHVDFSFWLPDGITETTVYTLEYSISRVDSTGHYQTVKLIDQEFDATTSTFSGVIDQPRICYWTLHQEINSEEIYLGAGIMVIEPGGELRIVADSAEDWTDAEDLNQNGRHRRVIESWSGTEEFQDLNKRASELRSLMPLPPNPSDDGSVEDPSAELDTPSSHAEILDWGAMECADFRVNQPRTSWQIYSDRRAAFLDRLPKEYRENIRRRREIELSATIDIIANSEDPWSRLLAIEASNSISYKPDAWDQAVAALQELTQQFDPEVVEHRVNHILTEMLELQAKYQANLENVPGATAPEFTLPTIDNQEQPLATIIKENQVVVLFFWRTWCDECIVYMKELEKLYETYSSDGLEVVTVLLSFSRDQWLDWRKRNEHPYPWYNLTSFSEQRFHEIELQYGIFGYPTSYVLDTTGCIMKMNLSEAELKDFLTARLGS